MIILILASAVIALTMFARANDQRFKKGLRWNLRLLGFVLAGTGIPTMTTCIAFFGMASAYPFLVIGISGIALVLLTTPGQKPWWVWIWKGGEEP